MSSLETRTEMEERRLSKSENWIGGGKGKAVKSQDNRIEKAVKFSSKSDIK